MSKRATKKAAKWVPKVGDKVWVRGTVTDASSFEVEVKCARAHGINEGGACYLMSPRAFIRPAVELFAWSPKKQPTPKGAKKK